MRNYQAISLKHLVMIAVTFCLFQSSCAATTSLHVAKYDGDGSTVLNETDVTYVWMGENLPVRGDGVTRYYLQGPVFLDDPDSGKEEMLRWNPEEDRNIIEKDLGAVKGTYVRELCDLVGGMQQDDVLVVKAVDGFSREFSYRNVYEPPDRQGPMVISWWSADEGYVPNYVHGMRLVFLADNSTNPWRIHALGVWDWHESAEERYWYYYRQGEEKYPTTTGLSVQYVSELTIRPDEIETPASRDTTPQIPTQPVRESLSLLSGILALCGAIGIHQRGRRLQ